MSKILVPDPVSRTIWEEALEGWLASSRTNTLLEWLLHQSIVTEGDLLEALGSATGARLAPTRTSLPPVTSPPEARLLEQNGFAYLGFFAGKYLVEGGPALPPALDSYLGVPPTHWEWVLAHPLRKGQAKQPMVLEELPESTGPYGLPDELRELIDGLSSRGAVDIHFERAGESLKIRYREATRMQLAGEWHGLKARSTLQLLKTWAGMATAAPDLPQDGSINLERGAGKGPLRMSHITTVDGESAVIRIPSPGREIQSMKQLGIPDTLAVRMTDCVLNEPGLVLCCGPTGSGKTTTLYGLLHDLGRMNIKILTIEDPVEMALPHAVQCAVDEAGNWNFSTAIRSFLRQDPDVIMIGEIRDEASAQAACQASLSGHCVLSTTHARSEEAALRRLMAWDIKPGMLAESVRLIINQRLLPDNDTGMLKPVFSWINPTPEELYQRLAEPAEPFA